MGTEKEEFDIPESITIAQLIGNEAEKVAPKGEALTNFYFNSLMTVENNQILIKSMDVPTDIDVNA